MLNRNSVFATILFVAFVQTSVAQDQFKVSFDRSVQIGPQTLPSGTYTVRQVTSATQDRMLEFSSDATKLDTTFTQIPSLQSAAPTETKVILEDEGGGARLSRIWVQGKNYGYEFPGKTVPATAPVAAQTSSDSPQNYVRPATSSELAEVQSAETLAPTPLAVQAQAQPQPAPITPAPENSPAVVAQATPTPVTSTQPIPATALGWASILFAGLTVAAAGWFLLLRSARRAG